MSLIHLASCGDWEFGDEVKALRRPQEPDEEKAPKRKKRLDTITAH